MRGSTAYDAELVFEKLLLSVYGLEELQHKYALTLSAGARRTMELASTGLG